MQPSLSIALCTHNPRADFLARTLDSLRRQTLAPEVWELLLIDNASDNGVCGAADLAWHPRARVVREDEVGLTHARVRAISETSSHLLLFVDDDNVLKDDYAERLVALAEYHDRLGCFGAGRLIPEFEVAPAAGIERHHLAMLALREIPAARWSNDPFDGYSPWGAGLAVRRPVAEAFVRLVESNPLRKRLGRQGAQLNSGEDIEFTWAACQRGEGKGLFPELEIVHLIDRRRLDAGYLLRLAEGHVFSHTLLDWLHDRPVRVLQAPSIRAAAKHLLRGRIGAFLTALERAWVRRHLAPFERAYIEARQRGAERALRLVQTQPSPGPSDRGWTPNVATGMS